VFKLESLKIKHRLNHFALRMKLLIKASQQVYQQLQKLQAAQHQIVKRKAQPNFVG
jgi:hypothetical protein